MSYELPARFADIKKANPSLLEHNVITGKSGAQYFGYRLNLNVKVDYIQDDSLLEFYKLIKAKNDRAKVSQE